MKTNLTSMLLAALAAFTFTSHAGENFTTVVDFTKDGTTNRGKDPRSTLVSDGLGNLWGTTAEGGTSGVGTVFKVNASTGVLTTLVEFTGNGATNKGEFPNAALVSDGMGNFWGTTTHGGANSVGTIFKVNASTGVLTTVVEFTDNGATNTGKFPFAGLISDGAGNFWGTTQQGGANRVGTVFKISVTTGLLTTVLQFNRSGGYYPFATLVGDGLGNFWGSTADGGANDQGTIFRVNASTGALTTVVEFTGNGASNKGSFPSTALLSDEAGNFWGTTNLGGANGYGTVFKINATTGLLTTLVEFTDNGLTNQGVEPISALVSDGAGSFLGVTRFGGERYGGTFFKINATTGLLATLFNSFGTISRGHQPLSGLVSDGVGNFWGTTADGGAYNHGTIYKISASVGTNVIAFKNDPAAGTAGAKFSSFGNPAMNENGHVAFEAKLTGGDTTSKNKSGIWADDSSGTRQLVVRTGWNAGGALFSALKDPVYNGNEEVAFIATLKAGTGDATSANNTGVWSNTGGPLHLVAREGFQAPGCAAGTNFASFTQIALPDQGGVVLLAKLTPGTGDATTANNVGIWAVDSEGNLQLVLRTGFPHPATGVNVTVLSFLPAASGVVGQTRSFTQGTGDLLYRATFADGTSGIFKVVFP